MRFRTWALALVCCLWLAPSSMAQAPSLYLTDESTEVDGYSDVKLLDPAEPSGEGSTQLLHPVADEPGPLYWASAPITDDLVFEDNTTVTLYFEAGLDASSTSTVTLYYVADSTETLGSDSDAQPGQSTPHQETFTLETFGKTVPEGAILLLEIEVTDAAVAAQLAYGGESTPSGIDDVPWVILDTDGDGFGDSEERRAGSDPTDAESDPDNPAGTDTTDDTEPAGGTTEPAPAQESGEEASPADESTSPEALLASMFFLLCLVFAGIAIIGRPST